MAVEVPMSEHKNAPEFTPSESSVVFNKPAVEQKVLIENKLDQPPINLLTILPKTSNEIQLSSPVLSEHNTGNSIFPSMIKDTASSKYSDDSLSSLARALA